MRFFTRLIFALIGMAFAILFAIGVLCWLALYVVFACLRWLTTGQKPQVLMMWQQIQAMRKGMQTGQGASWSSWSRSSDGQWHEAHGHVSNGDHKADVIEDAVVREIHDKRRLP
ncbi:hypothetical protein [Limnohabitans sp. INBF002]|uniref:hypothetical protein n=1 Tax=Limnohabitans sp. INBF002 TaxID=2986280 RepID=UPI0023771CB8|nr:hypothetical protein [Limnohabitans sp. INBF002]BDU52567.1 hypothetical protein LINBF2_08020 [Limnohabitans sp. INBF002]